MKSENSVSIDIREIVTSIAGILKRTRDQLHAENLPESQLLCLSGGQQVMKLYLFVELQRDSRILDSKHSVVELRAYSHGEPLLFHDASHWYTLKLAVAASRAIVRDKSRRGVRVARLRRVNSLANDECLTE